MQVRNAFWIMRLLSGQDGKYFCFSTPEFASDNTVRPFSLLIVLGVYDLVISDVQLEDEATFICQANVKLYRDVTSPIMETLTSQPVHLNVVSEFSIQRNPSLFPQNIHSVSLSQTIIVMRITCMHAC